MAQMKGDDEVHVPTVVYDETSIMMEQQEFFEVKDPVTNEVFVRAPFEEAEKHMRRLSNLLDIQQ